MTVENIDKLYHHKPIKTDQNLKSIQDFLLNIHKNSISKKIKTYQNLCRYSAHFNDELIKETVNKYFLNYFEFLDTSKENFIKNFQHTYGERIFELVMAHFLNNRFELKRRSDNVRNDSSLPDFEFKANGKTYFLECTTRDSTLIPEYIKTFPKFNDYYSIAKIFHEHNEKLKFTRQGWHFQWWFDQEIIYQNIWLSLEHEEKIFLWKKLGFSGVIPSVIEKEQLHEFSKWLTQTLHILGWSSRFIPDTILSELEKVNLTPNMSVSWDNNDANKFHRILAKFVAQAIIDKLSKQYFQKDIPIILSVSLALLNDPKMIKSPKELFHNILPYLQESIKESIVEKSKTLSEYNSLKETAKRAINNLYAIIIDTTWYNWFPELIGATLPDSYSNHFAIIYNTNISQSIETNSDQGLFNSHIPYQVHTKLEIE